MNVKNTPLLAVTAALVLALLLPAGDTLAGRKKRGPKAAQAAALRADRALIDALQHRNRGLLDEALAIVRAELEQDFDNIAAHRLYQEIQAVGLRHGRLTTAEYEHYLRQDPSAPIRKVLAASAQLIGTMASPSGLNAATVAEIGRLLAAAEGAPEMEDWANLVAADLALQLRDAGEAKSRVLAAYAANPKNLIGLKETIQVHAAEGRFDLAAKLCMEVLDRTPWRAPACLPIFPLAEGKEAASEAAQDLAADKLEQIERSFHDDPVVLQALETFYTTVDEGRGTAPESRRLRKRIKELIPSWVAPVAGESPYEQRVEGGEFSPEEREVFSKLQGLMEATEGDPEGLIRGMAQMESSLPQSDRVRSTFYRLRGHTLREAPINDRDGSRAAIAAALAIDPDDPQILNELAYMSAVDKVQLPESLERSERSIALLLGKPYRPGEVPVRADFDFWQAALSDSLGAFLDTRGWILYQMGRHAEALQELETASFLTSDGTVEGHLGRVRYALGDDDGAFQNLLLALALGCEDEQEVHDLAAHVYEQSHIIPGGLGALIEERRSALGAEGLLDGLEVGALMGREAPGAPEPPRELGSTGSEDGVVRSRVHGLHEPEQLVEAPEFSVRSMDGTTYRLADLRGKVVVLDFWATWCGPCVESLPSMAALARRFDREDVLFLAVSIDDSVEQVQRWLEGRDLELTVAMVERGMEAKYEISTIPQLFVIDQEGRVAQRHRGYDPGLHARVAQQLDELLD